MSFPPDAFLIGAEKCGTTTLTDLLDQHAALTLAKPLESDYFTRNRHRGTNWYRSLFASGCAETCLEVSRSYSAAPLTALAEGSVNPEAPTVGVPARIHAANADARFIYVIRDPVERTYSSYWHAVRYGYKDIGFRAALAKSPQFLDRSRYVGQLRLYLEWFPLESFHILLFEDMRADPVAAAKHCFRFLGLDNPRFEPIFDRAKNESFRYNAMGRLIRGLLPSGRAMNRFVNLAQTIVPKPLHDYTKRVIVADVPPLSPEDAAFLEDYFHPHNEALAKLTGIDLSKWRGPSSVED